MTEGVEEARLDWLVLLVFGPYGFDGVQAVLVFEKILRETFGCSRRRDPSGPGCGRWTVGIQCLMPRLQIVVSGSGKRRTAILFELLKQSRVCHFEGGFVGSALARDDDGYFGH